MVSVSDYFAFCLCFPWNMKLSSVVFASTRFETEKSDNIWIPLSDRYDGFCIRNTGYFAQFSFWTFCMRGIYCWVIVMWSIWKSAYLETEEWDVRDAWFSLWCYICILSLALSLCACFLSFPPTQRAAVWCSLRIMYWCQTNSHRNHRNRKICRSYFPTPRG